MENLFTLETLEAVRATVAGWIRTYVLALSNAVQLATVLAAFLAARFAHRPLESWLTALSQRPRFAPWGAPALTAARPLMLYIIWLLIQWISILAAARIGWPHHLITIVVSLLSAWVAIRLVSGFVRDPFWSRLIAVSAWSVAALNIVGMLDATIAFLDGLALYLGGVRISLLGVLKGMFALAVLLWLASVLSRLLERRIAKVPTLTPSVQVLFSKLFKIVLTLLAVVIALGTVGIDLTAFAVFTGAVGVGIGFGLQKVVSNLISGMILLLDRSIKPGDVVAVGDTYGWVNSLGARYASVITRDGIEHLIPNEEFITQRVENWSFSHRYVRLKIPVGISYKSDVRRAVELCLEAARATERVLEYPEPACLLKGFGDSSVELEIRIWIDDPRNGVSNVKSEVLLGVWDRFHDHGIEIPFPQRDLHLKTPGALGDLLDVATHARERPEPQAARSARNAPASVTKPIKEVL